MTVGSSIVRLGVALAIIAGSGAGAQAWLFDNGLESRIREIRVLFRARRLMDIYTRHVDPRYKLRIGQALERIRADRRNGPFMASRLGFASYRDFLAAADAALVERFFALIVNPPRERVRIDNQDYQRIGLLLSLLFSCFETGMEITGHDIYRDRARVFFSANRLKMVAYFVFLDGSWYITEKSLLGRDF